MKKWALNLIVIVWILTGFSLSGSNLPWVCSPGLQHAYGEEKPAKTGIFTAYTASPAKNDARPGIMASGKEPYIGAAACPKFLEFGTRIRVQGMGEYTCEDRMHRKYRDKNRFDILMKNRKRALNFGKQKLRYEIVNE